MSFFFFFPLSHFFHLTYLLINGEFYIIHLNSAHILVPLYPPLTPVGPPKRKQNKQVNNNNKNLSASPSFLPLQYLFILVALGALLVDVQGLWFLVNHHHWILNGAPLEYPVAATTLRKPAGFIPQDLLHQVLDGADVRVGQPQTQLWAWVVW